jgi:hypothetical protein
MLSVVGGGGYVGEIGHRMSAGFDTGARRGEVGANES